MKLFRDIKKSLVDKREYLGLELPNKLKCIIVKDPHTTVSAATMNVSVGNLCDSKEFQGLAHFLEHMLFLGSEKYPEEGTYKTFIKTNGGTCNASTSSHRTNFYYSIKSEKFFEALDIFAQFFISPLLNEDCTNRELNAVDSEAAGNYNKDVRRLLQIEKYISDEKSIYNKFSTGNLKTLQKPGLREALVDFHKKYYSSDIMALAIYHNEDNEEVAKRVQEIFSGVVNKSVGSALPRDLPHPFPAKTHRGKLCKSIPIQNKHKLHVSYYFQDLSEYFPDKPLRYLSHLLGHECEGSIRDHLVVEGLAYSLMAGSKTCDGLFTQIEISVDLTKKGIKNVDAVLGAIGAYIAKLKQWGAIEWIYNECKDMAKIKFDFMSNQGPVDTTNDLAGDLLEYGFENIFFLDYMHRSFTKDKIEEIINLLTPENAIVCLSSQTFTPEECTLVEPIYGTHFSLEPLSEAWCKLLAGEGVTNYVPVLPEKNLMIPKDLSIKPTNQDSPTLPVLIENSDSLVLYHLQSNKYEVPKVYFSLTICDNTLGYYSNQQVSAFYKIWSSLFTYVFRNADYSFDLASCSVSLSASTRGINIEIRCFSDTLQAALAEITKYIGQMRTINDQPHFEDAKEKYIKNLENLLKSNPGTMLDNMLIHILRDKQDPTEETIRFVKEEVTWERFQYFNKQIFREAVRYYGVVMGNYTPTEAQTTVNSFIKSFELLYSPRSQMPESSLSHIRISNLPLARRLVTVLPSQIVTEKNSAILIHYQFGPVDMTSLVNMSFITNFLKQKFFYELRTKQQLGYSVSSGAEKDKGVIGFNFFIQSNHKSTEYCRKKIDEFISTALDLINNITHEEFSSIVDGMISSLKKPFSNLFEEAQYYWDEIATGRLEFNHKSLREQKLIQLTPEEVKAFTKSLFLDLSKRLELHLVPQSLLPSWHTEWTERVGTAQQGGERILPTKIECTKQLKRSLNLYPIVAKK